METKICCICQNTNQDELIEVTERVFEGHFQTVTECLNAKVCWETFDRKNGINKYQKREVVKC